MGRSSVEPVELFKAPSTTAAAPSVDAAVVDVALWATVVLPLLALSLAPHQVSLPLTRSVCVGLAGTRGECRVAEESVLGHARVRARWRGHM